MFDALRDGEYRTFDAIVHEANKISPTSKTSVRLGIIESIRLGVLEIVTDEGDAVAEDAANDAAAATEDEDEEGEDAVDEDSKTYQLVDSIFPLGRPLVSPI